MCEEITAQETSDMLSIKERIRSFQKTFIIDGKKFRWRYTLIPYESMATLGFFYNPTKNSTTATVYKDAVGCIYCRKLMYGLKDCRSKRKNFLETLISVLKHHWDAGGPEPRCLYSYMKWKILRGFNGDWSKDEWFHNPLDSRIKEIFAFSYRHNWPYVNDQNLKPQIMAEAGLIRYDNSFTGFEDLMNENDKDACYCIYCKRILGHWQLDDNPLKEHFKASQGGQCFFFSKIDRELVKAIENTVEISQSYRTFDGDDQTISSPNRKKRSIKKHDTQTISDDAYEMDDARDLILTTKNDKGRASTMGRRSYILDDTKDDIGFSPHTMLSPSLKSLVHPDGATKEDGGISGSPGVKNITSHGDLRNIPLDVELSSDSASSSLSYSAAVPLDQLGNDGSSSLENRNLSPLQRKIC